MGLLRRASDMIQRHSVAPSVVSASNDFERPTQWSNGFVSAGSAAAGVRVDETTVIGLPGTLQALRVMSGVFAMTPLIYYRREKTGRFRAEDSPLYRLMHEAPNSHQSAFHFRELMMGDILLMGEFNAYVSRDSAGRPVALTRLRPGTCKPVVYFDPAEGETVFYDATLPDHQTGRFAQRDILHIVGFSRNGISGLSPMSFAREALGGAVAADRHAQRFWARGGKVDTVLTGKGKISPSDKSLMRNDWNGIYGNPNGEGTAVLDQDVTVQFLTNDNQKSQFLETRQFNVTDLARIWGVPPHLIFDLSRSTNNNIEMQSLEFVIYHLGPHFARVESAAQRLFAQPGHTFEHLTDALVKGDLKSRMDAYWQQRQMGIVSANDLLRRENMPEIPGPAGSTYWRPGNMEDAGQPSGAPTE